MYYVFDVCTFVYTSTKLVDCFCFEIVEEYVRLCGTVMKDCMDCNYFSLGAPIKSLSKQPL
jgi:hypothetical protein